jgi:hypothetical protein
MIGRYSVRDSAGDITYIIEEAIKEFGGGGRVAAKGK